MEEKLMENIKNIAPPVSIKVKINGLAPADFSLIDDVDEYSIYDEELATNDFIWHKTCDCVGNCLHEIEEFSKTYSHLKLTNE